MLSDPLPVTYNGSSLSLPRTSGRKVGIQKLMGTTRYNTPDGQFDIFIERSVTGNNADRTELLLRRTVPDPDGDPFTGNSHLLLSNSVGLVFETNYLRHETETDVGHLRAALLSLVDSTLQSRLIAGEM